MDIASEINRIRCSYLATSEIESDHIKSLEAALKIEDTAARALAASLACDLYRYRKRMADAYSELEKLEQKIQRQSK